MRTLKGQLFIFLIIFVHDSSCAIDALYDTGKKVWDFYKVLNESNLASTSNPITVEQLFGNSHEANQDISEEMYEIHEKLNAIEISISPKVFSTLLKIVTSEVMVLKCIDELSIFINSINDDYKQFHRIIIRNSYIPNRPLDDLPSIFMNIKSKIRMIRKIMTVAGELLPHDKNLVAAITRYTAIQKETLCGDIQPITEILAQLFKIAIISEIKTSLILNFANIYEYREDQGGTEWKTANDFAKLQFRRYFKSYLIILEENLGSIEGLYVRACDPYRGNWTLNENAYEIDGTTQDIIFQYDWTKCATHSCQDVMQDKTNQCPTKFHEERSSCQNTLIECVSMGAVQACVLNSGPHRFRYVNSTEYGLLGGNSECLEEDGYIIDHENSRYAACACDCNVDHHRISAVLMEGNLNFHEVITGLRFIRANKILYIQPRVGKLEANGYIQQESERWLAIPKNTDAFQIRAIEETVFFFDDLRLPAGFVLTGVKFSKSKRGLVEGFAIEIFGAPFDYSSGRLDITKKVGRSASTYDTGLPVAFEPISSIGTYLTHIPNLENRSYVKLKRSLLTKDFGQSTLPSFDGIAIRTDPPSTLAGLGMFHKGIDGYAGFISLRAYGIRYKEYFEDFIAAHTIGDRVKLFSRFRVKLSLD